ncbi:MAG: thiamine pyrophosphate-binding protein [Gammaproteobacteria bacterium]|nr:thiamine pyrophosphate-binding protein [Gammaproteobacteria bacterium]
MTDANTITGRSAFLSLLEGEGVDTLFGNPGTTELPIMDALREHPDMSYVLGMQESIVVAMADGYSRASGKLSACNVHVAPGLGNAMGSLYNAKFWGSPVLVTAGQQELGHGLTEPLLYDPLVPIAQPLVKWAVEVARLEDLPRIVRRAAKIALTPPTGPVFISLPGDILNDRAPLDLGHPTRVETATRPSDELLGTLADKLLSAKNPVIVAGHEVATCHAHDEAARLAEVLGAPVYQQTVYYGAHFRSEHPSFLGPLSRDQQTAHDQLKDFDLMFVVGADVLRMSVWSAVDPLPDGMRIVQLGLNDWEMGKNYPTELAVRSDVKVTLEALNRVLAERQGGDGLQAAAKRLGSFAGRNWSAQRDRLREQITTKQDKAPIDPDVLMARVADALPSDAVVVDEGLTSTRSLPQLYPFRDSGSFFGLASGGIGFAIAGAVGINLALRDRPMCAVIGDGSAMYSVQALWTAANMKLPITYVIANNRSYRIIKERLLAFHGNEHFVGMDFQDPPINWVGLAESLGVRGVRIEDAADVGPALREGMQSDGPTLLDCSVADGFSD